MWKTVRRPLVLGGSLWWIGSLAYALAVCATQSSGLGFNIHLHLVETVEIALAWTNSPVSTFLFGVWVSFMFWDDMRQGMDGEFRVRGLTFLNMLWRRSAWLMAAVTLGLLLFIAFLSAGILAYTPLDSQSPQFVPTAWLLATMILKLTFIAATAAAVTTVSHALVAGTLYNLALCMWMIRVERPGSGVLVPLSPWSILDAQAVREIPDLRKAAPWMSDMAATSPIIMTVSVLLLSAWTAMILFWATRKYGSRVERAHF
ncbi:MAG: hypothetical protein K6T76_11105 [Alicyclobacillus mali]|uniref:hypothetical protein n=1 Tax=Alicyclobacillus mali (ex Roth et al. 2021) TaxID=1123961 RepID=UPI0023F30094|nr:hypothetical protein [Alicyclobacillus mali (ex Roth et al. 2021)]MCL6489464.1 hypothetical protein [Alicyclobacillus mali (ex Roth et al. 2021)]